MESKITTGRMRYGGCYFQTPERHFASIIQCATPTVNLLDWVTLLHDNIMVKASPLAMKGLFAVKQSNIISRLQERKLNFRIFLAVKFYKHLVLLIRSSLRKDADICLSTTLRWNRDTHPPSPIHPKSSKFITEFPRNFGSFVSLSSAIEVLRRYIHKFVILIYF